MRLLPVCDEEEVQLADTRALRSFATEVHLPILRQAGQAVTCSGSDSISSPVHLPVLPQAGQAVTCSGTGTDSIRSPASSATSRSGSRMFWFRFGHLAVVFFWAAGFGVFLAPGIGSGIPDKKFSGSQCNL